MKFTKEEEKFILKLILERTKFKLPLNPIIYYIIELKKYFGIIPTSLLSEIGSNRFFNFKLLPKETITGYNHIIEKFNDRYFNNFSEFMLLYDYFKNTQDFEYVDLYEYYCSEGVYVGDLEKLLEELYEAYSEGLDFENILFSLLDKDPKSKKPEDFEEELKIFKTIRNYIYNELVGLEYDYIEFPKYLEVGLNSDLIFKYNYNTEKIFMIKDPSKKDINSVKRVINKLNIYIKED